MTGPQLLKWRTDHDLTLREVATDYLGGEVTHTAVSRWERDSSAIPQWAADKLLGHTQITLPLDQLHQLLDLARELNIPSQELIGQALREYLTNRKTANSPDIRETKSTIGGVPVRILESAYWSPQHPACPDPAHCYPSSPPRKSR